MPRTGAAAGRDLGDRHADSSLVRECATGSQPGEARASHSLTQRSPADEFGIRSGRSLGSFIAADADDHLEHRVPHTSLPASIIARSRVPWVCSKIEPR